MWRIISPDPLSRKFGSPAGHAQARPFSRQRTRARLVHRPGKASPSPAQPVTNFLDKPTGSAIPQSTPHSLKSYGRLAEDDQGEKNGPLKLRQRYQKIEEVCVPV